MALCDVSVSPWESSYGGWSADEYWWGQTSLHSGNAARSPLIERDAKCVSHALEFAIWIMTAPSFANRKVVCFK